MTAGWTPLSGTTDGGHRRPSVFLKAGGDRRVKGGHPWAYSNEVRMDAEARSLAPGTLCTLHRVDGKPLGMGSFNPHSLIAFRLFSRDPGTAVDAAFIERRLRRALDLRRRLFPEPYFRLVHGEADGLPGLVIDRFGDAVVVQVGTAGMEALTPSVIEALDRTLTPDTVVLRNDASHRRMEGLELAVETVRGSDGDTVEVREDGLSFAVDPVQGQKTGWYYDQRLSRAFVAGLAAGGRVLDVYCYGGAFGIRAAAAGAEEVLGIDRSDTALALARRSAERCGVADRCTFRTGVAFDALETLAADGDRFDVVVADPPAFAKSRKELKPALRGYRKLSRLAATLVEAGGFLFIASCSHVVDDPSFEKEVTTGLERAGRTGRILRRAGAAPDHPVHPHLPESRYLKTLLLNLD